MSVETISHGTNLMAPTLCLCGNHGYLHLTQSPYPYSLPPPKVLLLLDLMWPRTLPICLPACPSVCHGRWWEARVEGKSGLIPSNYVELM